VSVAHESDCTGYSPTGCLACKNWRRSAEESQDGDRVAVLLLMRYLDGEEIWGDVQALMLAQRNAAKSPPGAVSP
jgi:hypothetical protein